jgi:ribosome-associated toxin RatA of RatAB toxin-antitoxin module
MSKAYHFKEELSFPTAVGNFKSKQESENLNLATDSAITQAVKINIEKLEGRQRRVFAKIQIPYPAKQVWQVLTDYEAFAEFMPNLIQNRRLEHLAGSIRVEQVRLKSLMGMKFSTRLVLDVEEKFPDEIHFQQIEGDFKSFSGYWRLEPWERSNQKDGVDLLYNFLIWPKQIFPMALVEHVLSHDVPASMLAIRRRVEKLFWSK